jgi:Polyketide cyclase / dehydrase and lipid transport
MILTLPAISRQNMPISRSKRQVATWRFWTWVAILMFISSASVAADSPIRSIDVTYEDGVYVVSAVMFAPVTQAVAWDVLTDFDHQAQWVPNLAESKVLKRDDTSVTIEQHGVAKYGAASFPYTTERKIEVNPPGSIKTKQLRGSLRRVESTIILAPDGKGTSLNYHLEVVPSLLTAAIISKSFLEHEVGEQFTAIIAEMVRRAQ